MVERQQEQKAERQQQALYQPDLHIVFGVDSNYVPAMGAAIHSIVKNNVGLNPAFHILAVNLSQDDKDKLAFFAEKNALALQIHDLDRAKLAKLPDPEFFGRAIYNRLLIGDVFARTAKKVLYLDADLICLGDITPLTSLTLHDKIIAAVIDPNQAKTRSNIGRSNAEPYFSSGLLYIDVEQWNARGIATKVLQTLAESGGRFECPDQDALNIILEGKVLFLDKKWSVFVGRAPTPDDTIFLQFAGPDKPWQIWSDTFQDKHFTAHLAQTPWADWQYTPKSRKHRNKQAKCLFKNGQILKGLYWYVRFLFTPRTQRDAKIIAS